MKTLYLDLSMGAAGDMLTAALYELLDEKGKEEFISTVSSLGLDGVSVEAKTCQKCGITGTHMDVLINGSGEHDHHHGHEHENEHHHGHSHRTVHDIEHIIDGLPLNESIRSDIKKIYMLIADAESIAHNCSVSDIHFHEVGTLDAIVDVASVCILLDRLSPDRIVASPVCTGFGKVKCAHGILPVPAPATANILKGIPVYAGNIEGELCTPTGAALVRYFADEFGRMPEMSVNAIGYGMGTKDFPAANCVRVFSQISDDSADKASGIEDIIELSCNIDDMTGEEIGHTTSVLLDSGAADVYTTAIGMKKSRPGVKITVMCRPDEKDKFVSLMFKHTTTLGVRVNSFQRYVLERRVDERETSSGIVHIKRSEGYGVRRIKYEYEDVCSYAKSRNISFEDALDRIDKEINDR